MKDIIDNMMELKLTNGGGLIPDDLLRYYMVDFYIGFDIEYIRIEEEIYGKG